MRPAIFTAFIIATALFMENVDGTVLATSLPAIAADLHQDPIVLKLALTSYMLTLAVFIPASGWVADRFGARTVFCSAIAVFTVGSLLCGAANSLPTLIAARVFQGLGGAMMVPVGRLVLLRSVAKSEMVDALAYLTIPALMGPVVGPPLGGFITTYFHWRWIFWINVPIGAARHRAGAALHPEHQGARRRALRLHGLLAVRASACSASSSASRSSAAASRRRRSSSR